VATGESKRSVDEGVALKHLSRLAFVFIPLTFVTSVFGMNGKGMTDSGPHVWVCIGMSLIIGGATLISWFWYTYPGAGSTAFFLLASLLLWMDRSLARPWLVDDAEWSVKGYVRWECIVNTHALKFFWQGARRS